MRFDPQSNNFSPGAVEKSSIDPDDAVEGGRSGSSRRIAAAVCAVVLVVCCGGAYYFGRPVGPDAKAEEAALLDYPDRPPLDALNLLDGPAASDAPARVGDGAAEEEEPIPLSPAERSFQQGMTHVAIGQLESALPFLREAISTDPDHVKARYNLGVACARTGRIDEAKAQQEALRGLDPNSASLLGNLIRAHSRMSR